MTCFDEEPEHTPDKDDWEAWEKFELWKETIKPNLQNYNTWELLKMAFDTGMKKNEKQNKLLAACYILTKVHINNGCIIHQASPEWLYNGVTDEQYQKAWEYIQDVLAGVK